MSAPEAPAPAPIPPPRPQSLRKKFFDLSPDVSALRGRRAGIVSRGIAYTVDFGVVFIGYPILVWIWGAILALLDFSTPTYPNLPDWAEVVLPLAWNWLYFTGSWVLTGRTVGMTLMGLKVVARKSQHVGIIRANVRYYFMFATIFILGPVWLTLSKSRLAIHDRVARTQVIYDGASKRQELAVSGRPVAAPAPSTD